MVDVVRTLQLAEAKLRTGKAREAAQLCGMARVLRGRRRRDERSGRRYNGAPGAPMMYPYAEFLIDFDRTHRGLTHRNAPENRKAAIIIETRPDYFLPMVVRETMFFLGSRWNLHMFCGEHSYPYAQGFLRGWDVRLTKFPNFAGLTTAEYNGILLSPAFWKQFSEEKLLVFQTDSLLSSPYVDRFLGFDFVGAPCQHLNEHYIANGGLSLRTRSVMLECLSRMPPRAGVQEDVYFTAAVRQMGASMPDYPTACRFAVESAYIDHPFGVHATDKVFHSPEVAGWITTEMRRLVDLQDAACAAIGPAPRQGPP